MTTSHSNRSTTPLYEIAAQYHELATLDDPELPEEAVRDTLEGLEGALTEKAINVAAYFQNLEATVTAIKAAEAKMATRRKAIEGRVAYLKRYLRENMERTELLAIEAPEFTIKLQKNPGTVVIDDADELPATYVREKIEFAPDKPTIREALRSGESVPGAHLEQSNRLVIK